MDRIDFEIVQQLRKNARISNKELAEQVGLAASTCLSRMRYLRASGVLRGYHAEVNAAAMGMEIEAMVAVQLTRHTRRGVESFRQHLLGFEEVQRVLHTSGASDFLVQISVRNTEHLRDFVLTAFTERREVKHIETSLIYQQWDSWDLPDYLPEGRA